MIDYEHFTLANGLQVFVHTDPTTPMAAMNVAYRVGSKNEDEDKTGFAHLFEHLMFRGSRHIANYDRPLQTVGGENNAYTSADLTNYHLSLPAVNIETAFWLESDRMLALDFQEEKLEAEKRVVIEEFKQNYLNQPYGDAWLRLHPLAYKVHPYRWATIGKDPSHIARATLTDVEDFFYRYYRPNNASLVVAGQLSRAQVEDLAQKWFGDIPAGASEKQVLPSEPPQAEMRVDEVKADVPMEVLYMAFHMAGRAEPEYYLGDLLSDVLGRERSSRLYRRLVKDTHLCAAVKAYVTGAADSGLLVIQAYAHAGQDLLAIEQEIWQVIEGLKQQAIPENELKKVQNKAESTVLFNEVELLNRSTRLAYFASLGQPGLINQETHLIQAITPLQLQNTAQEILREENVSKLYYRKK
ncbi:MAG: pitrilysin family protein [Microscillaceae bacterium]